MIKSALNTVVLTLCFLSSTYSYADSLQFSASAYSVTEDGTVLTITVDRVDGSVGAVSVDYATSDGSASAGSDYTAVNGTLTFNDTVTSQTFTVGILEDSEYEGDEIVNLSLSNASGATLGTPSTAELTIVDNDPVPSAGSLQFSAPSYTVNEGDGTASITVTRVGGSFGAVSVDYAISNGSATAGSDYTAANGTLDFADGDAVPKTISVSITDDGSYEGNETLNLGLSNAIGATLGTPSTAILTIEDNDPVPPAGSLQFSAPTYTVNEGDGTASITVTRVNGSFGVVTVDYATSDGTANAGSDYTAVSGTLSFADGVTSQTISVSITNDNIYEGDETLDLALSNPGGGASLGSPVSAVLTIAEDDPVPSAGSLQFSAPTYTENEDGGAVLITVTRVNGSSGTVSVDYASSDGTASAGSDYTAVNDTLTFADGVTSQSFSVSITNDNTYEGDETLDLTLSNPSGGADLGSPAAAVLTIAEDDPTPPAGSLQFSASSYTVNEDGTVATITITRVDGSFGAVSVDYATGDGTASADADYTAVSGTLNFADGVTSRSFTIDILDDADYEGDETVNLVLSNPGGGAGLGSPAAAVLTIAEDDPTPPAGSLQLSAPSYLVDENGTTALITVTRVNGSFGTVAVDYASSDGSATAGSDYTAVSGSLSFADGVTSQTFTVDILDDVVYEGDETVDLILSNPSGNAGLGSPATAVLTITENEPVPPAGSLQFSAPSYMVAEDGVTASITVTRVGGSFGTVTVDYASSDDTATAGADYTAVIGSLSFADGVTSQTIAINILDDTEYEGDETMNLSLSNPSGGAGLGSPASAVLTITEDEPIPPAGSLLFSAPSYTVAEDGVTASITVTRVGGSFGTVTVDYASSDGTAIAGSDYSAVIGTLVFADGVTSESFTVDILEDVEFEGDETVNLSLSNPSGGAGLGSPSSAVLTIADAVPEGLAGSLQFSEPSYRVAEFGVVATITVTRVGGSFGNVTVDYTSRDGTATAGADYIAVNGSLRFANGETSRTFSVEIVDDSGTQEGNESLDLILSNPTSGASLGSPAVVSLIIAEKDAIFDGSGGGGSMDLFFLIVLLSLYMHSRRKKTSPQAVASPR